MEAENMQKQPLTAEEIEEIKNNQINDYKKQLLFDVSYKAENPNAIRQRSEVPTTGLENSNDIFVQAYNDELTDLMWWFYKFQDEPIGIINNFTKMNAFFEVVSQDERLSEPSKEVLLNTIKDQIETKMPQEFDRRNGRIEPKEGRGKR